MPQMLSIDVQTRQTTGKKVALLRRDGVVPGVVYGHGVAAQPVQVTERALDRFLAQLSASSLISVQVQGEEAPRAAIIRAVQRHPITQRVRHFDFMQVSLSEAIRMDVPIVLAGESPAVVDGRGVLLQGLSALEVECLPMAIPGSIVVDISGLNNVDDMITVADLQVPEGVEVHSPADQMVVRIIAERATEEEAVAVEEPQEVEVITEKRTQERRKADDEG
jgi:large subunit ribosomal protein L25